MFQGLLRRAERSIDSVVAKYVNRAAVAIPLLIAGGFATAALVAKLVELYGSVTGYGITAGLFAVIGLVTMAIVGTGNGVQPAEEAPAEPQASEREQGEKHGDEESFDPTDLLTPEVKAFLASAAPAALPSVARGIGRNLPLILILALIGFVISRFAESSGAAPAAASAEPAQPHPEAA